jgi:hypothetical protein
MQKLIKIKPKGHKEFQVMIATHGYEHARVNIELFLPDDFTNMDFARAFSYIVTEAIFFYRGYEDITVDFISLIIRNVLRAYNKEVGQKIFKAHGYKKIADKLFALNNYGLVIDGPFIVWEYMQTKL